MPPDYLLQVAPVVFERGAFALKGGAAIRIPPAWRIYIITGWRQRSHLAVAGRDVEQQLPREDLDWSFYLRALSYGG